jgi:hypothetical protein
MQGLRIYADSKLVNTVMNPITRTKLDGAYNGRGGRKRLLGPREEALLMAPLNPYAPRTAPVAPGVVDEA